MDIKELMIGDWVLDPDGEPARVEILNIKGSIQTARPNGMVCLTHCDRINPIPLTEEILVKNGFEQKCVDLDVEWVLATDVSFVILYKLPQGLFYTETSGDNILLESVHQLQHLLRLCGVEKSIIL